VTRLRLANAPVSYGAFEVTVAGGFETPDPEQVLAAMAGAGYEGTELGPPGYLGEGRDLAARLERHGLELVGGFVPLRFTQPDQWKEDFRRELEPTLDLFEATGAGHARPVLADAGGAPAGWEALADGVKRACELSRGRGFEPTFHHHAGSHVESTAEIERLLETTDVGLTLDTGHLALAGGDPVRALREWGDRIDHVHLKDVRLDLVDDPSNMLEVWRRGVFCELGTGDADVTAFVDGLRTGGYRGWVVIEQDRMPASGATIADAAAAQERNRRWLLQRAPA
jgi:inosose dehydratase